MFIEVLGGQLTKYISGGKSLFNRLPDGWTTSFIFLILMLAAALVSLKKYHARYHAFDAVAAPRHCQWWVQLIV